MIDPTNNCFIHDI